MFPFYLVTDKISKLVRKLRELKEELIWIQLIVDL